MKRLSLLSLAFVATMISWAEVTAPSDFRVICKNGSVARFCGKGTELSFSEDASMLYISTEGQNSAISYVVDGIAAIEFTQIGSFFEVYDYVGAHIDVAFSPTDESSYFEVEENVITDENHDDYGDFIENFTPKNTVVITYKEGKASYTGNPSGVTVKVNGNHVVVTSTKKNIAYTLNGETGDGSFKLYSDKKSLVTLNGVSITNPTGAAINIQTGKTMMMHVVDGTTNYLEDGVSYTLTNGEQQKGTIFSEGQLIFSGNGNLTVKSNYGHGIASDDYVRVRGGNIAINSVRDGISTKDRFVMYGGTLGIDAKQDGIDVGEGYVQIGGGKLVVCAADEGVTASYEGDEDTGVIDPLITPYVKIEGGFIKVTTTGEKGHGLRAMSAILMYGGVLQIGTKGAGSKALMAEGDMTLIGGKVTAVTEGNALYESDVDDLSSSAAIRSKGLLKVENMTVEVKSLGTGSKGINNVGDVIVKNSQVTVVASGATHKSNGLDSRSRGITSDGGLIVSGGALFVKSYDEPLETHSCTFSNEAVYGGFQVRE